MSRQLIYTRKAKDTYTTPEDENLIISVYKDQAAMLNDVHKKTIKGKGVLSDQVSSLVSAKLNEADVTTHSVKQLSETKQLNRKADIVLLEVVLYNVTAGSFSKCFGVGEGIRSGTPIAELYYKNDDLDDSFINDEHIKFLGIASDEDIAHIKTETRRINDLLGDWLSRIGLSLIDFKLEFGKGKDGKIVPTDKSSPDNYRLWDAEGYHMDKDVFRRDSGSLTDVYEVVLKRLRGLD